MKRIYIIAGEKSGEHYGAQLVSVFRQLDPQIEFYGFGGNEMEAVGVCLSRRLEDLEMIGLTEVLQKIATIRQNFSTAKKDIENLQPDALLLIDYPGFNLRMAKWAKKKGFKVFYFIAPQTWAWKKSRNKVLAKFVDVVYNILPFETEFLKGDQVNAHYVGHPMVDDIHQFLNHHPKQIRKENKTITKIALLPGSRQSELRSLQKSLLSVIDAFPQQQFILAGLEELPKKVYQPYRERKNVKIIMNSSLEVMAEADFGIVKSGTSTLQAALIGMPQSVVYKVSRLTGWMARFLVRVEHIALPNLIAGREIVREYLQRDCNPTNLIKELRRLENDLVKKQIIKDYQDIRLALTKENDTVHEVASSVLQYIVKED